MNGKKVAGLILIVSLAIVLIAGCSRTNESTDTNSDFSLTDLCEKLYSGIEVPEYEIINLDKSNFEYFSFIPYDNEVQAVAADAIVNIEAHSMVLLKSENKNAAELANEILKKANPNKWLCVGAERVGVAYSNHYVVLVMSSKEITDAVTKNFELNMNKLYDGQTTILYADNEIREFE